MARRKRGMFGWIIVVCVVALAGFGIFTLAKTETGQTTIKAAEAGGKAAAKVIKTDTKKHKR